MENSANEQQNSEPIKVSSQPKDGEDGKKKMLKYIIIGAVIIIAAVIIAVAVKSHGKKTVPEGSVSQSGEETGTAPDKEENATKTDNGKGSSDGSYTLSGDIQVDFDNMTTGYAEDLLAHLETTTFVSAEKPTVPLTGGAPAQSTSANRPTSAPQAPTKPAAVPQTEKTTVPASSEPAAIKTIAAFFSGTYYFDGSMITGGEETPMEIAMRGEDFEVFTEMDGMDIAILNMNSKTYMLNPSEKKYTELTSALKKTMGIEEDTFKLDFGNLSFDASKPSSVTDASIDGKKCVCYTYRNDSVNVDFFAVNGSIVQVEVGDVDGGAKSILKADEFSAEIPSNMMTLNGYKKTNLISFMSAFM